MSTCETIDVYDLLNDYIHSLPIDSKERRRIDFNNTYIDDNKFKSYNLNLRYEDLRDRDSATNIVAFSSTFINSTANEQTNNLRTEKRTTVTCRFQLTKSVMRNGSISLQLTAPNSLIQISGCFTKEKTITSEKEEFIEEELNYTLDTQVVIQPGHMTEAKLVIKEDNYKGKFKIDTIFEGTIFVELRDKKKKRVKFLKISKLEDFLTPEKGFRPVPEKTGAVVFTNEGICNSNYVIDQHVEVLERPLVSK